MTKYFDELIRKQPQQTPPSNNIIIGDGSRGGDDRREYVCENCHYTIYGRISADEIYCNHCKSSFVVEDVRKKQKLSVPKGRSSEVCVSTTPNPTSPFDKKPPELKGGFLALSKKGTIRFTSYTESSAGKENAD